MPRDANTDAVWNKSEYMEMRAYAMYVFPQTRGS